MSTPLHRSRVAKGGSCSVEQVSWAPPKSRFTYHFEDVATWLVKRMDRTATCELMGIDWRTVGRIVERDRRAGSSSGIVERVVNRRKEPVDRTNLRAISVDEISYRKGHRYLTLGVDMERGRVWEDLEAIADASS